MTASEIGRLLHAKRSGKGKWMAKCPHHEDRMASLSITDMGNGRTRLKCFAGCAQGDVVRSAGLKWSDLRPGEVSAEIRARMNARDERDNLERRLGLVMVLEVLEPRKRNYWLAAERGIRKEMLSYMAKHEPEKAWRYYQKRRYHKALKSGSVERLWVELYGPQVIRQSAFINEWE